MRKGAKTIFILSLLFLPACAKEKFQIGREDPEKEVQKCMRLSKKKLYEETIECLEIFKSRFPNTPYGMDAALHIADTYFTQHQYLLAADSYLSFIKLNPNHPKTDYAYYRAGLSYLNEAPKAIDRDQQNLFKAKETLQQALRISNKGTYQDLIQKTLLAIDERLAKRLFYIARFYYRTGEYLSCVPRLEELSEKYPKTQALPKALYYLTKSYLKLGKKEKAAEAMQNLNVNFPSNPWTKKAKKDYKD